jgi:hypothetical protein
MTNALKKFIKKNIARRMNISDYEMDLLLTGKALASAKTDQYALQTLMRKLYPVIEQGTELIRLGPQGDGGYLLPDDLKGIEACFSPGVSTKSGFEKDCANLGMKVFLADKSVEKPAESHELFHFIPKYVGALTNDDFMTLDDWVNASLPGTESDLLLQIDIEGSEYEAFYAASSSLMRRFRIIIAEFHSLDELWNQGFFRVASRVFDKILQTHVCCHIHPNNCCGSIQKDDLEIPRILEFTFIRRDRLKKSIFVHTFPHPLDYDNTGQPPLALPKCWYSS